MGEIGGEQESLLVSERKRGGGGRGGRKRDVTTRNIDLRERRERTWAGIPWWGPGTTQEQPCRMLGLNCESRARPLPCGGWCGARGGQKKA